ncbi:MAG: radical SAM family heme chaperone HemW [Bdellovibrionia bacterium]
MKSLYIHFPFCEAKCHYCDFYSLGRERTKPGDSDKFEKALRREIQQSSHLLAPELDTIFFGGGTPSMTAVDSMARCLEDLWKNTSITSATEWTMEANPSSIDYESLKAYRGLGINRVSMGVQAMRPDLLTMLGRVHSREAVLKALENVFKAGFDNVSVDLLCGVPGQTEADLTEALKILTDFPVTHLSCYLLTLAPHHKMFSSLPNEDIQLEHLLFIHNWMTEQGFEHYEISNFAKPDKKARHNLHYWQGGSYLGFGPSAHSYNAQTQQRWKNVSSLHKYSSLLEQGESTIEWTETLTPEQLELEKWMLSLRLNEGFPESWLTTSIQKNRVSTLKSTGLLEMHPGKPNHLRLTSRGFALSDHVIRALA